MSARGEKSSVKRFSDFFPFPIPQVSNFGFSIKTYYFKLLLATDGGRKTEELRNRDCVVHIFARSVFLSPPPPSFVAGEAA